MRQKDGVDVSVWVRVGVWKGESERNEAWCVFVWDSGCWSKLSILDIFSSPTPVASIDNSGNFDQFLAIQNFGVPLSDTSSLSLSLLHPHLCCFFHK